MSREYLQLLLQTVGFPLDQFSPLLATFGGQEEGVLLHHLERVLAGQDLRLPLAHDRDRSFARDQVAEELADRLFFDPDEQRTPVLLLHASAHLRVVAQPLDSALSVGDRVADEEPHDVEAGLDRVAPDHLERAVDPAGDSARVVAHQVHGFGDVHADDLAHHRRDLLDRAFAPAEPAFDEAVGRVSSVHDGLGDRGDRGDRGEARLRLGGEQLDVLEEVAGVGVVGFVVEVEVFYFLSLEPQSLGSSLCVDVRRVDPLGDLCPGLQLDVAFRRRDDRLRFVLHREASRDCSAEHCI